MKTWLKARYEQQIADAILKPLDRLWAQAYSEGYAAAAELAGYTGSPDPTEMTRLIDQMGREWASQIAGTRIDRLAAALEHDKGEADLSAAIRAVMDDPDGGELIARTEVVRAMALGAKAAYRDAGIAEVVWVTLGPDPCPACIENEASGHRKLGEAFPAGATEPPQHPRCQCALFPYYGEST